MKLGDFVNTKQIIQMQKIVKKGKYGIWGRFTLSKKGDKNGSRI